MLQGQTWEFANKPTIISTGTVGGPFEAEGKIASSFDLLHEDLRLGQESYEKAQKLMVEQSVEKAIEKTTLCKEDVQFLLAGDLINQLTPSNFASRTLAIPYLGLFSACSTSAEGLALAALLVNSQAATNVIAVASSHNAATERQFRYPTEYGSQKPPTSQWTATASGAALVSGSGSGPKITSATIGKVIDMGMTDPLNLGGAMAPAAVDTITAHFRDRQLPTDYYDLIVTGDLGAVGLPIAKEILTNKGLVFSEKQFQDCGLMIYREGQPALAGASGAGCSAAVTYGYLYDCLRKKEINKLLLVATGALFSPLSFQQNETIPCIAHAVSIEVGDE